MARRGHAVRLSRAPIRAQRSATITLTARIKAGGSTIRTATVALDGTDTVIKLTTAEAALFATNQFDITVELEASGATGEAVRVYNLYSRPTVDPPSTIEMILSSEVAAVGGLVKRSQFPRTLTGTVTSTGTLVSVACTVRN